MLNDKVILELQKPTGRCWSPVHQNAPQTYYLLN